MALNAVVICCLVISLTLYLVATVISAWPCGGLFRECQRDGAVNNSDNVISGLLLVCIIMTGISLLCCLIAPAVKQIWVRISAYLASFIAFVAAFTMEIYFHTRTHCNWSSFLTIVATILCLQVFVVSLADLIPKKPKPEMPLQVSCRCEIP